MNEQNLKSNLENLKDELENIKNNVDLICEITNDMIKEDYSEK